MEDDKTAYTIYVGKDLWKRFKEIVTRDKTMNEAIIELIEKEVERHGS